MLDFTIFITVRESHRHFSVGGCSRVWFNALKNRPAQSSLGLALSPARLAICHLGGEETLRAAWSYALTPTDNWALLLADAVREHDLKGLACHVVLSGDDYKLSPVEAPEVPAAEVDQALLWSLRDMLDAPPQDMTVQSFPFASGLVRPGRNMRYAVAARKSRIQSVVSGVLEAGLDLHSIDIPELALRNLAARLPENSPGVCIVSKGVRNISIAIYRDGELYLARQLAGAANLDDAGHPLTVPRLADQLGLDLLRTLDYYDSQQQQRLPAAIYLQPLVGDTTTLLQALTETVRLPVRQLGFGELIKLSGPVAAEQQADCVLALGAALRTGKA